MNGLIIKKGDDFMIKFIKSYLMGFSNFFIDFFIYFMKLDIQNRQNYFCLNILSKNYNRQLV